jgi:hypothetical protein
MMFDGKKAESTGSRERDADLLVMKEEVLSCLHLGI